MILRLYEDVTSIKKSFLNRANYVHLNKDEHELIKYYILRDTLEFGKLQPLMKDPYIEDIHCIGLDPIHLNHKIFKMVETNIRFSSWDELDSYLKTLGEKVGSPVSEGHPIIDAAMPDGSRLNVVYSRMSA